MSCWGHTGPIAVSYPTYGGPTDPCRNFRGSVGAQAGRPAGTVHSGQGRCCPTGENFLGLANPAQRGRSVSQPLALQGLAPGTPQTRLCPLPPSCKDQQDDAARGPSVVACQWQRPEQSPLTAWCLADQSGRCSRRRKQDRTPVGPTMVCVVLSFVCFFLDLLLLSAAGMMAKPRSPVSHATAHGPTTAIIRLYILYMPRHNRRLLHHQRGAWSLDAVQASR